MNFENVIAKNKNIIAKVIEKEEMVTKSGLILQGNAINEAMEDLRRAEVISSDSEQFHVGDIVIYTRFVGSAFGDYIILSEKDVFGIEK